MSDLLDLSTRDLEKALKRLGVKSKTEASANAMGRHLTVLANKVTISWEMYGMGHNEPASYGVIRRDSFTKAQVLEALGR